MLGTAYGVGRAYRDVFGIRCLSRIVGEAFLLITWRPVADCPTRRRLRGMAQHAERAGIFSSSCRARPPIRVARGAGRRENEMEVRREKHLAERKDLAEGETWLEEGFARARFHRVAEGDRRSIELEIDGKPVRALDGDTVMVAVLLSSGVLRRSEFGDGDRAGFCLMGACQDCWMWTPEGGRVRACTTPAVDGMRLITTQPSEAIWPLSA